MTVYFKSVAITLLLASFTIVFPADAALARRDSKLAVSKAVISKTPRTLTVMTPRLSATFQDGMIVEMKNLKTGELHASKTSASSMIPVGIGHLSGDPAAVSKLHGPWGTQEIGQSQIAGSELPTMHHPDSQSRVIITNIPNGARITWIDLTNGKARFADEKLIINVWVDQKTGILNYKASATSSAPGIYGVQVPLTNLHPDHLFYVPTFGGCMYDKEMQPALMTLNGAPFFEAPVIGVEGKKGSFGLWVEDDTFRPNCFFMNWSGKNFSLAIESLNFMPFEQHKTVASVTWKLDVFDGGWAAAMTPYRNWYQKIFAPEIQARAAVKWADKIRVIIDVGDYSDSVLRSLAEVFDPKTVLFHAWDARAPAFDTMLPDWTPRAGYVDTVKLIQKFGFKTMAYVNTYCFNINSPVYIRDKIGEWGLLKKSTISEYDKFNPAKPASFADYKDGTLLYMDPLCSRWRKYHTDMMLQWRKETNTDANYEDVGGVVGDFGNGVVDGLSAGQGGVEQFRQLLRRNPEVPMASEYCPDAIAFAVRWPLRYQQVWGTEVTRIWWMQHMRPVSAYIYGPNHRPWIPLIEAESGFAQHLVAACSDALGGMAQFSATNNALVANQGVAVHMKQRAILFSEKQLEPYFTPKRQDKMLACMYKDSNGGLYKYFTDRNVQNMIGPDGKQVYARVTGLNEYATSLELPGWPTAVKGKVVGLNPNVRYALMPGKHSKGSMHITGMPTGIKISRYYETKQFVLVNLDRIDDSSPSSGTLKISLNEPVTQAWLNDKPISLPGITSSGNLSISTAFPARLILFKIAGQSLSYNEPFGDGKENGRYILIESGLERGGEFIIPYRDSWQVPGLADPVTAMFINWGNDSEIVLDYLVKVPSSDASVRVYLKNTQQIYGNGAIGRIYINGRVAREWDFGPLTNPDWKEGMPAKEQSIWDTSLHCWNIPVGSYAGQNILVSISTDAKASNNADELWYSRPMFVKDPDQKESFIKIVDSLTISAE